jgi:hypothetical protein
MWRLVIRITPASNLIPELALLIIRCSNVSQNMLLGFKYSGAHMETQPVLPVTSQDINETQLINLKLKYRNTWLYI